MASWTNGQFSLWPTGQVQAILETQTQHIKSWYGPELEHFGPSDEHNTPSLSLPDHNSTIDTPSADNTVFMTKISRLQPNHV